MISRICNQGQALINVYPKNRTDVPVVLKLEYAFLGDRKPTEIINRDYKVGDPLLVVTWFPDPHKNCSYCILMSSATTSRAFSVELNQGTCDTKSIRSWSKKIAQSLDNLKLFPLVEIEQYKMAEQIVCCASALAKNSYLSTSYANRKGMERYLLTQIREQLSELHAALALNTIKWLTGRNSLQLVNKVDYVVTYGHDSVGKCSTCHNVLETIRYESVTATYPDRILLLCSTCGLVGNHPACGSKVTISSDSMVNLPKFQVSVCADKHDINYSALNLPVTFGVCLINSRCFGYSAIETSWIVDRTSKATFVLEDCETRLSTGPYVLVALEIVGFDVSFGLKPIKVLSTVSGGVKLQ